MASADDSAVFPNGALRLFGIIGDPVSQVRAPFPATQRMRAARANAALVPIHVPVAHLPQVFAALRLLGNLDGLVVTVPHKVAMLGLVDRLTDRARLAGALNLARREPDGSWLGDMVDGVGFCGGLSASGFNPAGRSAFIAGAGGAGSAIAAELARAGARLHIFDAAAGRAAELAARLRAAGYDVEAATLPHPLGADLVVNATPLGMQPDDPMPIDPELLSPEMLVAEVVMKPPVTAFLQSARDRGCRVQLGEAVMLHQLDAMTDFFLGASPGRAADACS